ncbi:MAG: mechanosensitive ion channel [Nevskia sp.]|nr:mechanosensitive ion channel [Nevskia sp.]
MGSEFWISAGGLLALCIVLMALRPHERRSARNNLLWLLLVAAAAGAGLLAHRVGVPQAAAPLRGVAGFGLGAVAIRLVALTGFRVVLPALRVRLPGIVEDLVVSMAIIGAAFVWLRQGGLELGSIVATSAVLTGIIVFSMQETLGNILGGLALQLDNSIRTGDWVKIDDVSGRVVEVRWRYTAIETRNGETVVVPNSFLMKNRFTVIGSRSDEQPRWRRWVWLNIPLDAPPMRVCDVLRRALQNAEIPNVAHEPAPTAVLMDFVDGSARYALRYWLTDPQQDDPTDSLVRAHCHAALLRHGMRIALPQEERLITQDESHQAAQRAAELARRMAALKDVELFASLSAAEMEHLAAHLVPAPFVAGATMTHQGDVAHWLYLVVSGQADVWSEAPGQPRKFIAELRAGDIFGEMGMMTGAPRGATVTAKTDVDCYRLDKAGFGEILRARPDIATEMSKVLAARAAELEKTRNAAGGPPVAHENILARIRSFFALD